MERGCPYLYTGSKFRVIWPSVLIIQGGLQQPNPPFGKYVWGKPSGEQGLSFFFFQTCFLQRRIWSPYGLELSFSDSLQYTYTGTVKHRLHVPWNIAWCSHSSIWDLKYTIPNLLSWKENLVTTKRKPRLHYQEMELPGQSSSHSQELVDVEQEESTRAAGGVNAVRNNQSPSMFSTPDIEEVNSLQVSEIGCFIWYSHTPCKRFTLHRSTMGRVW